MGELTAFLSFPNGLSGVLLLRKDKGGEGKKRGKEGKQENGAEDKRREECLIAVLDRDQISTASPI